MQLNRFFLYLLPIITVTLLINIPVKAEESKAVRLSEIEPIAQKAELLLAQEIVEIRGIKLEPSETGLQIIIETESLSTLQPLIYTQENTLIIEVLDAVLALPDGEEFRAENPSDEISEIRATPLDNNGVRITVMGKTGIPTAQVVPSDTNLVLSLTAGDTATSQTEIEVVVTQEGQEDTGYFVPNASVGTRTDTQLRDIPQSIQVIPQQVIKDQQITRLSEALRNIPGAEIGGVSSRTTLDSVNIRGFNTGFNNASFLRNGIQDPRLAYGGFNPATIERIEILRGPASVLFGNLEPGGAINLVTKQPLNEPFYAIEASVGSFDFYRGAIDLSGPLNENGTVLYRFNAAAQTSDSFIDFLFDRRYVIAPTLAINFSENTSLNIWGEYSKIENSFDLGVPAVGSVLANPLGSIPRNRNLTDPNNFNVDETYRVGFDLQHKFNDDWQIRSAFLASFFTENRDFVFTRALLPDNRTLTRGFSRGFNGEDPVYDDDLYNLDTYVTGNFSTGSIQHKLTAGINLNWRNSFVGSEGAAAEPIDIFNPVYSSPISPFSRDFGVESDSRIVGIYIQDQMTLLDNLKFLLGGRFDFAHQSQRDILSNTETENNYQEFSPRLGIVYQPIQPISLYASYSRSFSLPDASFSELTLQPEFGTQYEVGVKAELNQRLSANLALYNLTRSNLPTTDPDNPLRTIQVGKQRSRGIEFDISGEVMPGWNIVAGYALTDAKIIEDNNFPVGNRLNNVSRNSWNVWTTYELQSGDLQGLGFGLGLFYVDNRQGDLANSFELPSYFRTDAAIFYNRDNWRLSINIKNLFDVDYFESASSRNRVFVGDPFTVQGTISWQF